MLGFFDPAIDASIELIEDQVSQLRRICGGKIDVSYHQYEGNA